MDRPARQLSPYPENSHVEKPMFKRQDGFDTTYNDNQQKYVDSLNEAKEESSDVGLENDNSALNTLNSSNQSNRNSTRRRDEDNCNRLEPSIVKTDETEYENTDGFTVITEKEIKER